MAGRRLHRTVTSLTAAATLAAMSGCTTVVVDGATPPADAPAPFAQTIPGTAVSFEMVPVPAGTVTMDDGGEAACGPFWIAATETTWDAYDVFVFGLDRPEPAAGGADAVTRPSKPYVLMDRGFGHTGYPVISVSYRGAEQFCSWLSERTGRRYRLPTEAEWRYVCERGAVAPEELGDAAWFRDNANHATHPVGSKSPDGGGVHDLHGNAWEWCTAADGQPIVMGGSYREPADGLGCAARLPATDAWNASDPQFPKSIWWLADGGFIGFRVICEPASSGEPDPGEEP